MIANCQNGNKYRLADVPGMQEAWDQLQRQYALMDTANGQYDEILGCTRRIPEHARNAGDALLEAKTLVGHGDWTEWLKEHFRGSVETARLYMRIADRWEEIVDAGLEFAAMNVMRAHLAKPKQSEKKEPELKGDDGKKLTVELLTLDEARRKEFDELAKHLMGKFGVNDSAALVLAAFRHCRDCSGVCHV